MATNIHDYTVDHFKAYHGKAVKPLDARVTTLEGQVIDVSTDADNQIEKRANGLYVSKPTGLGVTITQQNGYVEIDSIDGTHGEVRDGNSPSIQSNANGVLTWWIGNVDTTYPVSGIAPTIDDYTEQIPLYDASGNPILDSNNQPMYDTRTYKAWYIAGNPVLDSNGDVIIAEGTQGVTWTSADAYDSNTKTTQKFWFRDGVKTNYIAVTNLDFSADGYWVVNGQKMRAKYQGEKGDKGDTGSGFFVDRRYTSIAKMLADATPTDDSNFVLVEDTTNNISNLYLRQSSYVVDVANGEVVGAPNYDGYIFWGSKTGVSTVQGKSAYEVWLDINGYSATAYSEQDFIDSLKGEDGSTIMSLTQAQYDALADDATGKLNPKIIYNISDLGFSASDFLTQTEGKAYIESKISLTKPVIGVDKYWYYGNTKTTFKAEGEDGRDGIDGKDGITIVEITKSAYNALPNDTTGKLNPMVMYHISDETELQPLYTQTQIDAMFAEIDRRLKNGGL